MRTPDNWVVFKILNDKPLFKVLAGWSGGYLTGSSWRINSGVVKVTYDEPYYYFHGASGSVYCCHKNAYGLRMNNAYIWAQLEEKYKDSVKLMPETTNWGELLNEV
jgi:hypothetical protein